MAQQTVNGVVKDSSGKPVSGVKVSKVGESRQNSITDENGMFTLDLDKGDYIELNYADVALKRVKVNGESMDIIFDFRQDAMVDLGFIKTYGGNTDSVRRLLFMLTCLPKKCNFYQ